MENLDCHGASGHWVVGSSLMPYCGGSNILPGTEGLAPQLHLFLIIIIVNGKTLSIFLNIKLYVFYNDYETSYTTYCNHARWHRVLPSDGLRVGGIRSARRKPTCLTW